MDLTPFLDLIQADLNQVDQLIAQSLHSEIALIPQLANHLVQSGGKRLRPLIVLLSAAALGYKGRSHLELAATLELIHSATLLHDDVIDDSTLRRGQATANALWGNSASILVGDFLYSRAFQLMVRVNHLSVLGALAEATNALSQAEIRQLVHRHDSNLSEATYLQIIEGKTGVLFAIAAGQPAVLANDSATTIQAMTAYGLKLGIAFQLIDDALDYQGAVSQMGKAKGDDLADGKMTLPLIYALQRASSSQKKVIHDAISQGKRESLDVIIHLLDTTGALDYTHQCAKQAITEAKTYLNVLSPSRYRESLASLAEFALRRTH
jgi:octaprenyl-diphosphate synthase